MSMVGFPLLLIPLAIYNIIVFLMPSVSLTAMLFALPLPSGEEWQVALGDLLLVLGIVMLLLEVIRGARPGAKFLTDHLLSLIVCAGAAAEFLLWPRFANSTYFLLTLLVVVDFLTGVSLRVRRAAPAATAPGRVSRREPAEAVQPTNSINAPGAVPRAEPTTAEAPTADAGKETPRPPEASH
jgi:hypothetical protein